MKKFLYLSAIVGITALNLVLMSPSGARAEEPTGVPCNSSYQQCGDETTVDCLSCTRVDGVGSVSDPDTCTPK